MSGAVGGQIGRSQHYRTSCATLMTGMIWSAGCQAGEIEAVIETTGDVEFGTRVAFEAIRNSKNIILMNAGRCLGRADAECLRRPRRRRCRLRLHRRRRARRGDESLSLRAEHGLQAGAAGSGEGIPERYLNPDTQQEFAEKHQQKAAMVASFADGAKLALEAAVMGNGTGFVLALSGMHGHHAGTHVKDLLGKFKLEDFAQGGFVDLALGGEPHTGAFVMVYDDHPIKTKYMSYFKFGDGPLYMFYTPYHLAHMQLPHSVVRAVLFNDPTLAPVGAQVCDMVSIAKHDLKAGERLDGMGGFTCYGLADSYVNCRVNDDLPIALSQDCVLKRDVAKEHAISYRDVELPAGRLCDKLRAEQAAHFADAAARKAA